MLRRVGSSPTLSTCAKVPSSYRMLYGANAGEGTLVWYGMVWYGAWIDA